MCNGIKVWWVPPDSNGNVLDERKGPSLPSASLSENYWREVEESNSTGSAPVHGFQDRSATNHRHLPHVKELKGLVAPERLALSIPKALVSKTSAYAFRHGAMTTKLGVAGENRTPE